MTNVMDITITTLGALIGLAVAIFLIVKKVEPAYSMIAGAFVGGVIGGAGIEGTVTCMVTGAQEIMPAILRIVTSGVLAGTVIICKILSGKNKSVNVADKTQSVEVNTQPMGLPSIWASIVGPLIAVILLMLRPICGITIDPLVALPAGAIIGLACMRKMKHLGEYISYGLGKMMPVAILLIGTGTIVLDSLPHGSIFHASAGAMGMPINERIKLLPIDILEGFIIVLASTIIYGIIL